MASPGLTIPTSFTATGNYIPTVNRMTTATDRMVGSLRRLDGIGPGMSSFTRNLLGYAKSALLISGAFATAKFSVDSIMNYETAIQSLQAVTGASEVQMIDFKKQISELGITSKKSMTDIAKGFEVVGSAMSQYLDDPKALRQITEAGITLSKASRMELEPSLEALTSVMNQFRLSAGQAGKTIQVLTAGEIVGAVRTEQAAISLQEFGAVANNINVTVGESVALIEALGMQMDKSKIGVGARNILTAIGAAGGLDKKARMDLRKAGVDMKYLMDTSHSLSDRLHELGKISKDPIKMISVFGKENVTAASVIFNQLSTYDKFYNRIVRTSEAENQAATNSRTLSVALDQLKNRWANMLAGNNDVGTALNKTRSIVMYLADNMETIVSVGLHIVGAFALWKGAILAVRAATILTSAVMNTFYFVGMLRYMTGAMGAANATISWNVAMQALKGTMLANPAFWLVAGLAAVAGALYLAKKRSDELTEAYKKQIEVDTIKHFAEETEAVKTLAAQYYFLSGNIHKATVEAIKFQLASIDQRRASVDYRIGQTEKEIAKEKEIYTSGDDTAKYRLEKLKTQLAEQNKSAAQLATSKVAELRFIQSSVEKGLLSKGDLAGYFNKKQAVLTPETATSPFGFKPDSRARTPIENVKKYFFEDGDNRSEQRKNFSFVRDSKEVLQEQKKIEIVLNNNTDGSVDVKSAETRVKSVMPKTKSSFDVQ